MRTEGFPNSLSSKRTNWNKFSDKKGSWTAKETKELISNEFNIEYILKQIYYFKKNWNDFR